MNGISSGVCPIIVLHSILSVYYHIVKSVRDWSIIKILEQK
jgi:hypothetical protein